MLFKGGGWDASVSACRETSSAIECHGVRVADWGREWHWCSTIIASVICRFYWWPMIFRGYCTRRNTCSLPCIPLAPSLTRAQAKCRAELSRDYWRGLVPIELIWGGSSKDRAGISGIIIVLRLRLVLVLLLHLLHLLLALKGLRTLKRLRTKPLIGIITSDGIIGLHKITRHRLTGLGKIRTQSQ